MPNLYVTEQNSVLRKTGNRIIVKKDEDVLLDVKCKDIEAVLIFGNVQFTTQVVHELFEHGIEMAILTKTGKLIGQITSPLPKNIDLRLKQFKNYWDDSFRLAFSKKIVTGKIHNSINLVMQFSYNHPEKGFDNEKTALNKALKEIDSAESINELMGIEGSAARSYFNAFGKMLLSDFTFSTRKKHPSTDPVNALLSLTYTMLYNEISSLLDGLGFDPYLGYFHSTLYGRASLASDLVEEFRAPVADSLVLYLLNNGVFKQDNFYSNPKDNAVYLKREDLKRYFVEYEKVLNSEFVHPEKGINTTFRKCFRIQDENLAHCINDGVPYVPFKKEL